MERKPILQYGSLAGWPYCIAEAMTSLGYPSVNIIPEDKDWKDLARKLKFHGVVTATTLPKAFKVFQRAKFLMGIPARYSLVHYHASHLLRASLHPWFEGPFLASHHIPMLISFAGSDARIVQQARAKNPYFFRQPQPEEDEKRRVYLKSISRFVRYAATDCEMKEYVEPYFDKVFIFRQPVSLDNFSYAPPSVDRPPVILHVPTDPEVKGTQHIVAAVERLKSEGLQFEFRIKCRLTQEAFYQEIAACDIYVDELRCGSHGVTAVEAMAAGKPTVSYIRADLLDKYPPDLPLVNANPDTIYEVLRCLICEPKMRAELASASRKYVEKYHDANVVAREMLEIYRQIGL